MDSKIIKRYLIFCTLNAAAIGFHCGIYVQYLRLFGVNLLDINLINAAYMFGGVIFEVPTGMFADRRGRKPSILIGSSLLALSFFSYGLAGNLRQFVTCEVIGAIGSAFISGALNSWMIDSLNHFKSTRNQMDIQAKRYMLKAVAFGCTSYIGSVLYVYDPSWPWFVSAVALAISVMYGQSAINEAYFQHKPSKKFSDYIKIFKEGFASLSVNKRLRETVLFFTVISFIIQPLNMYWSELLKIKFGMSVGDMKLIFPMTQAALVFGAWLINRMAAKKRQLSVFYLSQLITVVGIAIAASKLSLDWVVSGYLIHEIGRGMLDPVYTDLVNKNIPEQKNRATINSFASMISTAGSLTGLIISGGIAKRYAISTSWFVSAVILMLAIIIFLWLARKEELLEEQDEIAVKVEAEE